MNLRYEYRLETVLIEDFSNVRKRYEANGWKMISGKPFRENERKRLVSDLVFRRELD